MLRTVARYHLEAEAIGGTEVPEKEAVRGRAPYQKYFLPQMWEANAPPAPVRPDLWRGSASDRGARRFFHHRSV